MAFAVQLSADPHMPKWGAKALGALVTLSGLALSVGGTFLAWLGGSPFYLPFGGLLFVAGLLVWRQSRLGAWLLVAQAVLVVTWAGWEVGLDGWALLPRIWLNLLFAGMAGLLLLQRKARFLLAASALIIIASGTLFLSYRSIVPSSNASGTLDRVDFESPIAEWTSIAGNAAAQRFSPLTQINPANVNSLKVAWTTHLGLPPEGVMASIEATPLMVRDTLYICDAQSRIIALDPDTGRVRWQFTPPVEANISLMRVCRGVTYVRLDDGKGECSERIVVATQYVKLHAVDARTGLLCPGFGAGGTVDLAAGMGDISGGNYSVTSPPIAVRGKLIIGGFVMDGRKTMQPSGVIRAFDAKDGSLAWAWDLARPDRHGLPPKGEEYTRGTPNSWAPMSADETLGLVYVPTGNSTPDYLSSHRSKESNRYSTSTVALDVDSGWPRWSYQQVHMDVWDYDNSAAPTLFDMPTPSGPVAALVQPGKRGEFFVLDRRSGKPLVRTVERPVPGSTVPSEVLSPTQPFPVGMPSLMGPTLSESSMWGLTPFDQLWCRIRFRQARYEGPFTPVGADRPTIVFPGFLGGSEWGGVAVDTDRNLLIANVNHFAMYDRLIARDDTEALLEATGGADPSKGKMGFYPQSGTRYAGVARGFLSPLGVPCLQPPYGEIAAIDLSTKKIAWRRSLGTGRDAGPFDIPSQLPIDMGVPNVGGALLTKSGLTFIGATQEKAFRAFDTRTGALLMYRRLPAGGNASPMTYRSPKTGKQYVVIAASGHYAMRNGSGDALIAYALP